MDAKEKYKQCSYSYGINISRSAQHTCNGLRDKPTHRQNRIFMHPISRKYPNKYSNILKAQKLKRITEDTMKIIG
jgi:hypothetical protein